MRSIRRAVSAAMAAAMAVSLASCGKKPAKTFDQQTADKVLSKAYGAEDITDRFPVKNIDSLSVIGDSGDLLVTGYGGDEGDYAAYVADSSFGSFTPLKFGTESGAKTEDNIYRDKIIIPAADGTIIAWEGVTDYGDIKLPDYDDPDFDPETYDFDAMNAAAVHTYHIYDLDRNGNVIADSEVTGLEEKKTENGGGWVNRVVSVGDSLLVTVSLNEGSKFYTVGMDGKLGKEVKLGDDVYLDVSCTDSNGDLIFSTWGDKCAVVKTVDAKTMKLKDEEIELDGYDAEMLAAGTGGYRFYMSDRNGFYGVTPDSTIEEVINWTDADMNGQYVRSVVPMDNGEFIVLERSWGQGGTSKVYRLFERDASELSETKLITIVADYTNPDIIDKVNEFNQKQSEYRIKIEDYEKYYEWDDSGKALNTSENQLKMDIAAGKTFDMMILGSETALYYNLANKGMFADLSQFLDSGSGLTKKDFVPNVLEAFSDNGKLYRISPTFTVQTYAAKKKFVDRDKWTFDEMLEEYSKCPEGMALFEQCNKKKYVFTKLYYGMEGKFIDYANGTCSYDSPEFIKMLEFIDGLDYDVAIDWDSMTEEEQQEYDDSIRDINCRNDRALLKHIYFYDVRSYSDMRYGAVNDELSLVGLPSANGNGARLYTGRTFMITSGSPCKEACWDFISSFFTEDNFFENDNFSGGLPTVEKYLDRMLDEAMEDPYWIGENGKKQPYKYTAWVDDKPIEIPNLTQEERDMLKEYLVGAGYTPYVYNEKVTSIVDEEIDAFFAGERSAKDTADIIQNRISILVSEQS